MNTNDPLVYKISTCLRAWKAASFLFLSFLVCAGCVMGSTGGPACCRNMLDCKIANSGVGAGEVSAAKLLDTVGGEVAKNAFKVLKRGGRAAFINGPAPAAPYEDMASLKPDASRKRAHLDRIVQLVTSGAVKLPQITTYALADAQAAHRVSEGRHLRGKLVFKVR